MPSLVVWHLKTPRMGRIESLIYIVISILVEQSQSSASFISPNYDMQDGSTPDGR